MVEIYGWNRFQFKYVPIQLIHEIAMSSRSDGPGFSWPGPAQQRQVEKEKVKAAKAKDIEAGLCFAQFPCDYFTPFPSKTTMVIHIYPHVWGQTAWQTASCMLICTSFEVMARPSSEVVCFGCWDTSWRVPSNKATVSQCISWGGRDLWSALWQYYWCHEEWTTAIFWVRFRKWLQHAQHAFGHV